MTARYSYLSFPRSIAINDFWKVDGSSYISATIMNHFSWLELQHAKHKKQISLTVQLMDGTKHVIKCDSATNSQEVATTIAEKANLTDSFGFSLFVSLFDKVSSLGSGKEHIMDAISQDRFLPQPFVLPQNR